MSNIKKQLSFLLVLVVLFFILAAQFNIASTDFSNTINVEIELTIEELDTDDLLSSSRLTSGNSYTVVRISCALQFNNLKSNYYLASNPRAPPIS